jgi:hypothetical protein
MSLSLPSANPIELVHSWGPPPIHNFLNQLPLEYALSLCTNTDSTTSSIVGPGRLIGSLLSFAGRRVEMAIDRFVERRLGRGPNVAALRIANELHEMHLRTRHAVELALIPRSDRSVNRPEVSRNLIDAIEAAHTLVRICNGTCPQCQGPYVPHVPGFISLTFRKAFKRLLSYLSSVLFVITSVQQKLTMRPPVAMQNFQILR